MRRQMQFTERNIAGLKAENKPYVVNDTRTRGLRVRVQPSGYKVYEVFYHRSAPVLKLGAPGPLTPERARNLALAVLKAAGEGASRRGLEDLARPREPTAGPTLGVFLTDTYEPWMKANRKRGGAEVARIRSLFADWLNVSLDDITGWAVEAWRLARLKLGRKPVTVNRDLAGLRACLARAVEWNVLGRNPFERVRPAKVENDRRIRFLDSDEEARLRTALDTREEALRAGRDSGNEWRRARGRDQLPDLKEKVFADHLKPMVLLAMNTGLRWGEQTALLWSDVRLDKRQLTVRAAAAKGGKTRHVPLNAEAFDALSRWRDQSDGEGLVFRGRTGERFDNVKKAWAALLEDASIAGFRWHDLRHHFASRLVMAGVDLNTVRELLGHADLKMTLRYAHLAPGHLAEAVERLKPITAADQRGKGAPDLRDPT